jgi:ribosome-dependent ATPase
MRAVGTRRQGDVTLAPDGGKVAPDTVDVSPPARRMVGVSGPGRVSKSTALALVSGARGLPAGRLEALGGDVIEREHRRLVCRRIAGLPQGLGKNVDSTLSVFEQFDFFGRLGGQSCEARD